MKRIAAVFLLSGILALSGCHGEETLSQTPENSTYGAVPIAEAMGVPEHYTFSRQSESGKSRVIVDADVMVPEVYGVDVLEAVPVVFTDEEVQDFVQRHTGDFEWKNVVTKQPYQGEGLAKECLDETMGLFSCSLWLNHQSHDNDTDLYREIIVQFWIQGKNEEIAYIPTLTYTNSRASETPSISEVLPLNEKNQADGCTISLEEAAAFGEKEMQALFPDFFLSQYGQLGSDGNENQFPYHPPYYALKYTRSINEIPVNIDIRRGVGDGSDYTAGTESVWMTVNDSGVCWLEYANPMRTGETVEKNVKLLSFQEILEIFEKVSLLSIQHLELYDTLVETVMDIREIRFGYMAVRQSERIGGYHYIPVWDFYGIKYPVYEGNQYYPKAFDEPVFTINAMNGTVIDRTLGY